MSGHNLVTDGQPQAGAFGLCREERLKYVVHDLGRDATPGVSEVDANRAVRLLGANTQLSAVGHSLDRVQHQIEEYLFYLIAHNQDRVYIVAFFPHHDHVMLLQLFVSQF
jgi:hypothetical protein